MYRTSSNIYWRYFPSPFNTIFFGHQACSFSRKPLLTASTMALAASGSHWKGLSNTVVFMLLNKGKLSWVTVTKTSLLLKLSLVKNNKLKVVGQMRFKSGLVESFLTYIKYSNYLIYSYSCGQFYSNPLTSSDFKVCDWMQCNSQWKS